MSKKTDYERIKAVWYKKLKDYRRDEEDEGFKDIEYEDESLAIGTSNSVNWTDPILQQAAQDYYCMAQHFLNEHAFANELEKIMWEYHSNGISARNISKLLKQTGVAHISRDRIWVKLKKLEDIMKGLYLST